MRLHDRLSSWRPESGIEVSVILNASCWSSLERGRDPDASDFSIEVVERRGSVSDSISLSQIVMRDLAATCSHDRVSCVASLRVRKSSPESPQEPGGAFLQPLVVASRSWDPTISHLAGLMSCIAGAYSCSRWE